ncbi:hypothetical protein NL64_09105 [Pseudomonas fluorescens]|nr:hypothetical protein NL64_09105 [Pseudomonas fluorescens]
MAKSVTDLNNQRRDAPTTDDLVPLYAMLTKRRKNASLGAGVREDLQQRAVIGICISDSRI